MKGITELALAAILLFLAYDKPTVLTEFANSILGKTILLVLIVVIAKTRGLTAGVIAALIMMMLMHEAREGFGFREGHAQFNRNGPNCMATKKDGSRVNCKNNADCGTCYATCDGETGECKAVIDPDFQYLETEVAGGANKDVGTFDVRLHEGMNNMNSRLSTIAAMKFQNGFTGNREQFKGFI